MLKILQQNNTAVDVGSIYIEESKRRQTYESILKDSDKLRGLLAEFQDDGLITNTLLKDMMSRHLTDLSRLNDELRDRVNYALENIVNAAATAALADKVTSLSSCCKKLQLEFRAYQTTDYPILVRFIVLEISSLISGEGGLNLSNNVLPAEHIRALQENAADFSQNVKELVGTHPPSCFISYARGSEEDDRFVADVLYTDLVAAGIDVRLDVRNNGQLANAIAAFFATIQNCLYVLVVATEAYKRKIEPSSDAVLRGEYGIILDKFRSDPTKVVQLLRSGTPETSIIPTLGGRDALYGNVTTTKNYYKELPNILQKLLEIKLTRDTASRQFAEFRDTYQRRLAIIQLVGTIEEVHSVPGVNADAPQDRGGIRRRQPQGGATLIPAEGRDQSGRPGDSGRIPWPFVILLVVLTGGAALALLRSLTYRPSSSDGGLGDQKPAGASADPASSTQSVLTQIPTKTTGSTPHTSVVTPTPTPTIPPILEYDAGGYCYAPHSNFTIRFRKERMWPQMFLADQNSYMGLVELYIAGSGTDYHFYMKIPVGVSNTELITPTFTEHVDDGSKLSDILYFNDHVFAVMARWPQQVTESVLYRLGDTPDFSKNVMKGQIACAHDSHSPLSFLMNIPAPVNGREFVEILAFNRMSNSVIGTYTADMPNLRYMKHTYNGVKADRKFNGIGSAEVISSENRQGTYFLFGKATFGSGAGVSSIFVATLNPSSRNFDFFFLNSMSDNQSHTRIIFQKAVFLDKNHLFVIWEEEFSCYPNTNNPTCDEGFSGSRYAIFRVSATHTLQYLFGDRAFNHQGNVFNVINAKPLLGVNTRSSRTRNNLPATVTDVTSIVKPTQNMMCLLWRHQAGKGVGYDNSLWYSCADVDNFRDNKTIPFTKLAEINEVYGDSTLLSTENDIAHFSHRVPDDGQRTEVEVQRFTRRNCPS